QRSDRNARARGAPRRRPRGRRRTRRRLSRRRRDPDRGGELTIRVVIADDQALVRSGFRLIVEGRPDLEVVGEAEDGAQAVALVEELEPDVILLDIRMPNLDGIEATRRIVASGSRTSRGPCGSSAYATGSRP